MYLVGSNMIILRSFKRNDKPYTPYISRITAHIILEIILRKSHIIAQIKILWSNICTMVRIPRNFYADPPPLIFIPRIFQLKMSTIFVSSCFFFSLSSQNHSEWAQINTGHSYTAREFAFGHRKDTGTWYCHRHNANVIFLLWELNHTSSGK